MPTPEEMLKTFQANERNVADHKTMLVRTAKDRQLAEEKSVSEAPERAKEKARQQAHRDSILAGENAGQDQSSGKGR